ncbi:MAG: hypothetical protein LBE85_11375, partial [Candidatus Accumulibacter sp.]|nr:hypothetical protein [Accumulibacter sp.]
MDKTLSLGIVFSALGAGAVTSALSTVTGGLGSIDKKLTESKVRIKALGLESVDAFARQKTELQKASAAAKKHQETTTQLGRAVALAKIEHQRASHALAAFQSELGKGSRRTAEQREKLRALKEELKASGRNLKGLTQEFTLARAKSERMKESVQQQTSALQKLRGALDQNGISTRRLAEHRLRITQVMRTEQTVLDRLTARYQKLRAAQTRYASARADLGSRWGEAMAAYGTARALRAPIGAFVRQDEALNALQVAMLDKNGQVHASYEGIKKQAIELGNLLPGTTADF